MRGMAYGDDIKKPTASIQIRKASDANGLEINDTVTLTVTGIVKSIDSPRERVEYDTPDGSGSSRMVPGSIEMEVTSLKVASSEAADEDAE